MLLTSERVNVETRDPLETGVERLEKLLLHQVVDSDVALSLMCERTDEVRSDSFELERRRQHTATKKCGREGWKATR